MKVPVASASKTQQKRGRKNGEESIQNLMHSYHGGTPAHVKAIISTWEVELNTKAAIESLPTEEWEPLIIDPRHTRGH